MRSLIYPLASRGQWFADDYPGTEMPTISKVLWHSTETNSWPSYKGGASAPTLTYHPRLGEWRQHFPLNRSARALRDSSDTIVRENRDNIVQVEIIGTCDPVRHNSSPSWPYMPELNDNALMDLADFAAFMYTEWGVPLNATLKWLPYPESYGNSVVRMSGHEFDTFTGHLGHQHASGNDHGDPGTLPIFDILNLAKVFVTPIEEDDMTPHELETAIIRALTRVPFTTDSEADPDLDNRSIAAVALVGARASERIKDAVGTLDAKLDRLITLIENQQRSSK